MGRQKLTQAVTINEETREVEFELWGDVYYNAKLDLERASSISEFVGVSKSGGKVWRERLQASYSRLTGKLTVRMAGYVRINRGGYKVCRWWDEVTESAKSQHNSA
jgi:hypothetical protein